MEELSTLESQVAGTALLESTLQSSLSAAEVETQGIIGTTNLLEDTGGLIVDSDVVPFLEAADGGHVILKGILDHNGALVLDSSQFAALMSSVSFDMSTSTFRDGAPAPIINTVTSNQPVSQLQRNSPLAMKTLPLTSSHQNQRINTGTQVLVCNDLQNLQKPEYLIGNTQQGIALPSSTPVSLPNQKPVYHSKFNQQSVIQHITTTSNNFSRGKGGGVSPVAASTIAESSVPISRTSVSKEGNFSGNPIAITTTTAHHANSSNKCNQESENRQPISHPSTSVGVEPPIGKGPHRCEICGKVFMKWPQFKRHKSEHLDEKSFRCALCSMTFNFETNLTLHTMIHEAEINGCLECKACTAKFSRLASLKSHVRVHEKEENLVCPECGDEFSTKARLETHIEEHKVTKSLLYRCKLCQKSFTQPGLLKDHSKEHAAIRNQLKILHPKRRKAAKSKASSSNSSDPSEELSKARQRQENKKKLLCNVCSKRFEKPSQLSRHMRIHTGEKPFQCKDCGRSFNQKGTLESHILSMHEKLKPFICHLCNCQFSQRGNLKAHVLKVHVPPKENERVFKCEDCSCVYRRLATLNSHIAKFHSKSPQQPAESEKHITNVVSAQPTNTAVIVSKQNSASHHTIARVHASKEITSIPNNSIRQTVHVQLQQTKENSIIAHTSNHQEHHTKNHDAEVKLVHEAQGKSRTCLVKVKKIGEHKWHLCPHNCTKAFRKPSDLIRHMRIHTLERPFTCEVCGKTFAVKSTLSTHMKIHTPLKTYECNICHKQFSILISLRAHERLHTGAKPFSCLQCGKSFRTSSQRKMHTVVHTRNAQGPSGKRKLLRIGDTDPKHDLPDPLRITSDGLVPVPNPASKSIIKPNTVQDGKTRPFRCNQCPSAFKKSSHLKQHLRSHSGERPYKCFQCHRSFLSSGVLKNHIRTHEGVRAFKCPTCQLSFTTNGSLTRHMTTHTNERAFVCPNCHKTFKTSVACRKHIKTHRSAIIAFRTKEADVSVSSHNAVTEPARTHSTAKDEGGSAVIINSLTSQTIDNPGFSQGPENIYSDDHFTGAFAPAESSSNGNLTGPNVAGLPLQDSNSSYSSLRINNANNIGDCDASMQQQIQDITAMIESGNLGSGEVSLQYSLHPGTSMDDVAHQIALAEGHGFDGSLFALQGGDSIDLPVSLPALMPLNHTSNIPQDSLNSIQASSFGPTMGPVYPLKQTNEFSMENHQPSHPAPVIKVEQQDKVKPQKDDENSQTKRIRESSRSISQQIYNEMNEKVIYASGNSKRRENAADKSKVNVCPVCSRGFKKRSDMLRHIRIHTGEKPFRCLTCGKSFRVKSTRDAHNRTHEGGKTVACHVCNNLFSTKSSLRVHIRLHTGAKPYKCAHCDRCFRTSGHRKAHTQSHFKPPKESNTAKASAPSAVMPANSIEGHSNKHTQKLPPVATIKDKIAGLALNNHLSELGTTTTHYTSTNVGDGNLVGPNSALNDPVQIIGSLQLTLDGPTVQNIHITSLDLNALQLSDEFLQTLGNVIFMTPPSQLGVSSNDLVGSNSNIGGSVSQGNGILAQQEEHQNYQNVSSLPHNISHQSTSSVLTGKDVNIGRTVNSISSLSQIQNAFSTAMSGGDLDAFAASNDSTLIPGFSSLTSSVASCSSVSTLKSDQEKTNITATQSPSNKQCLTCGKTFSKPSLLKRHMTTHTGEKPYNCDVCGSSFNQKNSLDVHKFTHSNERPFSCVLCPFKTVVKASLKKHWSRAHPKLDLNDFDTFNNSSSTTTTVDTGSVNQNLKQANTSSQKQPR